MSKNLTVVQIKQILKDKSISFKGITKKADLIALLPPTEKLKTIKVTKSPKTVAKKPKTKATKKSPKLVIKPKSPKSPKVADLKNELKKKGIAFKNNMKKIQLQGLLDQAGKQEQDVQDRIGFTGVKDLDRLILQNLDDKSLFQACQTNKYTRDLCGSENFWKQRGTLKYGNEFLQRLESSQSWRKYYKSYYVTNIYEWNEDEKIKEGILIPYTSSAIKFIFSERIKNFQKLGFSRRHFIGDWSFVIKKKNFKFSLKEGDIIAIKDRFNEVHLFTVEDIKNYFILSRQILLERYFGIEKHFGKLIDIYKSKFEPIANKIKDVKDLDIMTSFRIRLMGYISILYLFKYGVNFYTPLISFLNQKVKSNTIKKIDNLEFEVEGPITTDFIEINFDLYSLDLPILDVDNQINVNATIPLYQEKLLPSDKSFHLKFLDEEMKVNYFIYLEKYRDEEDE